VEYLTSKQILLIHSVIIDETGGSHGVREHHIILSLEELPRQKAFGKELYKGMFTKSAVYARNIIMNHPFIDGNKRTGMSAAVVFMENNDYEFIARKGEIEKFALKIISDKLELEEIAGWFKVNSRKLK